MSKLRKFIREQLEREDEAFNQTQVKFFEHENKLQLLPSANLSEDDNKRQEVLDLIKNNQWETDPQTFYDSYTKSKHIQMLTPYSVSELSKMKLFKLKGFNMGFALKKFEDFGYREIVAVHNNEPEIKSVGNELMGAAVRMGGCYLDHFDGFLSPFYKNLGFMEYKRSPFAPEYDPDQSFQKKYGKADVIFRAYKSCKVPN